MGKRYYVYQKEEKVENRSHFSFIYAFLAFLITFAIGFPFEYILSLSQVKSISPVTVDAQILGLATPAATLVPVVTIEPTILPSPTPTIVTKPVIQLAQSLPAKKSYTIAVIGDSMVDTMGELMEYLDHALKARYPGVNFALYNYGIGAENVEEGLARFNSPFSNRTRHFPPLPQLHPDFLIVGSFGYNPFAPYDRDRHWIGLTKLLQASEGVSPHVYLLAEIAPLKANFGKGPNGVNWSGNGPFIQASHIIDQLQNAVSLASNLHISLIDAFDQSKINSSGEGNSRYVNPSDGIHPSVAGHEFMANLIASSLKL